MPVPRMSGLRPWQPLTTCVFTSSEMCDQQLGEHANLPGRMLAGGTDDVDAAFGYRIAGHHRDQGAGCQMLLDQEVRKRGDPEPGDGRSGKGDAVVSLEPALRMN